MSFASLDASVNVSRRVMPGVRRFLVIKEMDMLRLLTIVLFVSITFASNAYSQTSGQATPILGYRVDEWLHWNLNGGELLLDHVELIRGLETKLAIRVCTDLPLAAAIRRSGGPLFMIANFMTMNHGYAPERLLFLRSEKCHRGEKKISDIEVWIVPQGAMLPSADDTLTIEEAEAYLFRRRGRARRGRQG